MALFCHIFTQPISDSGCVEYAWVLLRRPLPFPPSPLSVRRSHTQPCPRQKTDATITPFSPYRVTQKVSDLGWVDSNLRCSTPLLGQYSYSSGPPAGKSPNLSQPNRGPRPSGSPCTFLLGMDRMERWNHTGWNTTAATPPPLPIHSAMKGEKGERQADCPPRMPNAERAMEALSTLFRSPFSACTKARLLGPYGLVQWRSRASLHQIFIKINNPRQLLRRKLCCSSAAGRRGCHT